MNRQIVLSTVDPPDYSVVDPASPIGNPVKRAVIDLVDPKPLIDEIRDLQDRFAYQNVDIEAIEIGAVAYLTLQEVGYLPAFGTKLLCDPTRDLGPPRPIVSPKTAIDLFAKKRCR